MILGCGFTGSRVARRLAERGLGVTTVGRSQIDFTQPGSVDALRSIALPGCAVLHSVPSLPDGADRTFLTALHGLATRVVYLSTTGVYGAAKFVDEKTPVQPRTLRELARVETERAIAAGPWQSLILRPAAIYGPGRGVQVAVREGRYALLRDVSGVGSNHISRIYVDDLAAIAEAALFSQLQGAYPVADEHPCSSREIAEFCAGLLGEPFPVTANAAEIPESRRTNRRVDGSAICRALKVRLRYPSYREGVPAAMEGE